jgi:plasmid stabilization system protein ParE
MKKRKILWDKPALLFFRDAIQYIRKDSPQNADKVKKEILEKIRELSETPEIHNPDKYKIDNNGDYRAFELHRFRVAYFVQKEEIIITRVRNTRQEPLDY